MAIREILEVPDLRLKTISAPVEPHEFNADLRTLVEDMFETMYDAPGIGLAAIQIGKPVRIIVMDLSDRDNDAPKEPLYFVNPEIITASEALKPYKEGCLSVPEIYEMVNRPETVTINYLDYHGTPQTLQADGLLAVCIQHEMDHLNGVLFIDKLSALKRQMVMEKRRKDKSLKLI